MSKPLLLGLIGAVAAPADPLAMGGVGLVGSGVKSSLCFGCIFPSFNAVKAVAKPRFTAIPTKSAVELASVTGAGLVGASHASVIVTVPKPEKNDPAKFEDGTYVPSGPF